MKADFLNSCVCTVSVSLKCFKTSHSKELWQFSQKQILCWCSEWISSDFILSCYTAWKKNQTKPTQTQSLIKFNSMLLIKIINCTFSSTSSPLTVLLFLGSLIMLSIPNIFFFFFKFLSLLSPSCPKWSSLQKDQQWHQHVFSILFFPLTAFSEAISSLLPKMSLAHTPSLTRK